MQAPPEDDQQPDERQIRSLSDQSGLPPAQVRRLFRHEHARLGMGAKVHSYLAVLTASNVRAMLRRAAQRRDAAEEQCNGAQVPREPSDGAGPAEPGVESDLWRRDLRHRLADTRQDTRQDVQSWEDDGGRVREAW